LTVTAGVNHQKMSLAKLTGSIRHHRPAISTVVTDDQPGNLNVRPRDMDSPTVCR
jgi:hypothetical protein